MYFSSNKQLIVEGEGGDNNPQNNTDIGGGGHLQHPNLPHPHLNPHYLPNMHMPPPFFQPPPHNMGMHPAMFPPPFMHPAMVHDPSAFMGHMNASGEMFNPFLAHMQGMPMPLMNPQHQEELNQQQFQQIQQIQQPTPQKQQEKENGGEKIPTLTEIFDDLASRFVINIPQEELESFERMLFQIESAYWFYDDFYREDNHSLPKYTLAEFTKVFFAKCPLLSPHKNSVEDILKRFSEYKTRVPVYGAIILNPSMEKALFVRGYNSSSWGFPKGKVNKDEPDTDCAVREVLEEVGFDIGPNLNPRHYIEIEFMKQQKIKLFIIQNIPEDTLFCPRTRKEISKIEWMVIDDLPTFAKKPSGPSQPKEKNFFRSIPFFIKLKRWIANRKAKRNNTKSNEMTPKIIVQRNKDQPNQVLEGIMNSTSNSLKKQQPPQQQQQQQNIQPYSPYPESPPVSPRRNNNNVQSSNNLMESSFYTALSTPNSKNNSDHQQSTTPYKQPIIINHEALESQFEQHLSINPPPQTLQPIRIQQKEEKPKLQMPKVRSFFDSFDQVDGYPPLPPNSNHHYPIKFDINELKSNFK